MNYILPLLFVCCADKSFNIKQKWFTHKNVTELQFLQINYIAKELKKQEITLQ
jgi:hypothetical protein